MEAHEEKNNRQEQIKLLGKEAATRSQHLKQTREVLLTVTNRLKSIDPRREFTELGASHSTTYRSPRQSNRDGDVRARLSLRPGRLMGDPLARN